MPVPIRISAPEVDLSARFQQTTTVAASPAAGAETVIATLVLAGFGDLQVVSGILLGGWAAFTVGTSGVSVQLRIRQTDINGTVKANTGVLTGGVAAGNLLAQDIDGFDSGAGIGQYALTMTVGSGAAASTVSSLLLRAVII
jgi:hypothetical protein